jgi:eukaryotic-like serine/threonine-protein kinase
VSQNALLGELVKILDFGIAKLLQEDSGQTSSFMGTLPYSSPEQMEGQDLDSRSDVYSLGIMMFEMLTGKMPLQAETHTFGAWYKAHHSKLPRTFKSVNPSLKVPNALETLVMACLEKKSANRPQSIAEVLKALEPLEQRYSANHQIGNRISEALAKKTLTEARSRPVTPSPSGNLVSQATWPKNKPVAQIVFPQIFSTGKESLPTIWLMLPQKEIHSLEVNRIYNRIYKNFLCSMSPHPMVLSITAIYNRFHSQKGKPRWLPSFLDMKTPFGQEMLRLMGEKEQYQVFLFALENPSQCAHAMTIAIHPAQCSLLKQWAIASQSSPSVGQPSMTKALLQAEFEKLKPKIIEDLEDNSNTSPWA